MLSGSEARAGLYNIGEGGRGYRYRSPIVEVFLIFGMAFKQVFYVCRRGKSLGGVVEFDVKKSRTRRKEILEATENYEGW